MERFCNGALDDAAVKRIGFGAVTRSPVLVERTLAEIAGGDVAAAAKSFGCWAAREQRLAACNMMSHARNFCWLDQAVKLLPHARLGQDQQTVYHLFM